MSFNLVGAFRGLSLRSGSSSSSSSSSFFRGNLGSLQVGPKLSLVSNPQRLVLKIQNAHKKGARSTKNGRNSLGQRLGVKIFSDQAAKVGSIIVRQHGTKCSTSSSPSSGNGWTKVIVKKPFGRDSKSSAALTKALKQYLEEDQIFRTYH